MNAAILEVGPGGIVDVVGQFTRSQPLFVTAGGAQGQAVTIRGGTFRGKRTNPWTPGSVNGSAFFALGAGASYLRFEQMTFENVGNGCFQLGAPATDLRFSDITAHNVQRFIENRQVAGQTDATIHELIVDGCQITAFTKGAIRLQYDTNAVRVWETFGDSQSIDGDNFAMGVHLGGTVHDVVFDHVTMNNCYFDKGALYWNGDGFASEEDTYDLTFIDCSSSGCTDGGWDLKSDHVRLLRCTADDNKRNFRLWGVDVVLEDCTGLNPHIRGGTGTQAQVHTADLARVAVVGGTWADCDPDTIVFDADGSSVITVTAAVLRHANSKLFTKETNAQVVFGDITDTLCP